MTKGSDMTEHNPELSATDKVRVIAAIVGVMGGP